MFGSCEVIYCANSPLTEEKGKVLEIGRLACLSIQMRSIVKMPLSFRIELGGDEV